MIIDQRQLRTIAPVRSAKAYAYDAMRELIVRGNLPPMTPLPLSDVANDLGLSTMPVRHALSVLEAEGLVRQSARSGGAYVSPLTLEDFEEIQAVRTGIETFAARLGAGHVDPAELKKMERLCEELKRIGVRRDLDAYLLNAWALHNICYAASGRAHLVQLISDYQHRAERYLRLAVPLSPDFEMPVHFQETLLEAVRRRDGEGAAETVRVALHWTVSELSGLIPASTEP